MNSVGCTLTALRPARRPTCCCRLNQRGRCHGAGGVGRGGTHRGARHPSATSAVARRASCDRDRPCLLSAVGATSGLQRLKWLRSLEPVRTVDVRHRRGRGSGTASVAVHGTSKSSVPLKSDVAAAGRTTAYAGQGGRAGSAGAGPARCTLSVSPSTSVSFASTSIVPTVPRRGTSASVVATGASLTGVTVTVTVPRRCRLRRRRPV